MFKAYEWSLKKVMAHRLTTILVSGLLFLATLYLFMMMSKGFLPNEDTGLIFGFTEAEEGISFEAMVRHQKEIMADRRPGSECGILYVKRWCRRPNVAGNTGRIFIRLKPLSERRLNVDQLIQELRPKLATVPGIRVFLQNLPPIRIGGMLTKSQYQFSLQSPDTEELYRIFADS